MQSLKSSTRIIINVIKKTFKKKEILTSKNIQKKKKVFTLKNIGFFNSSLQYNFLKLRLYYNVNIFVNQISCDQYHEADIIQLFSKCLRGAAYMWY